VKGLEIRGSKPWCLWRSWRSILLFDAGALPPWAKEITAMSLAMSNRSPSADAVEKLATSIRQVLRRNGVSDADVPDLVQQVLLEAERSSRTPAAEPDRTRYIHAIARNAAKAGHIERKRAPVIEPLVDDDDQAVLASDPATDHDARDLAHKLIDAAEVEDPKGFDWLVRAKVDGEPVRAIADSAGVSQELVRQRMARLRRRMQHVAVALGVTATVVLVAMMVKWRLRDRVRPIGPDIASSSPREPTPLERALALRRDARRELDLGDAAACLRHLDEAKALDPAGDSAPDVVGARAEAQAILNPPQDFDRKR